MSRLLPHSHRDGAPRLIVLGERGSRRVAALCEAAQQSGWAKPWIIPYTDYLSGQRSLADWVALAAEQSGEPGCDLSTADFVVRIESPGENWEVEKLLLEAGIEPLRNAGGCPVSAADLAMKPASRGEIHHPRQWYFGFRRVLQRLEQEGASLSGLQWVSSPREIAVAFDKRQCQQRWQRVGLPIPSLYEPVETYDQLRKWIPGHHRRLFVKLRYGYSAMGAVALEWCGEKVRALTTVESVWSQGTPRLFLSKNIRVLQREFEIAWLIDTLAREEVLVEEWLPKARLEGRGFDLRVVTIGGRAAHVVGRGSFSPFTNLNLDGVRIEADVLTERLGETWPSALSLCEQAAAEFPESLALGIDLLVRPGHRGFALLEANAFGDYLPGLLQNGQSTYSAELQVLSQRTLVGRTLAEGERMAACSR